MRTLFLTSLVLAALGHGLEHSISLVKRPANWLQDLDDKLCDKMGNVLSLVPGFRDSCKRDAPEAKPTSQIPGRAPEVSVNPLREKEITQLMLRIDVMTQDLSAISARSSRFEAERRAAEEDTAMQRLNAEDASRELQSKSAELEQKNEQLQRKSAELEQKNAELKRTWHKSQITCLLYGEPLSCCIPISLAMPVVLSFVLMFVFLMCTVCACNGCRQKHTKIEKEMKDKTAELEKRISQFDLMEVGAASDPECETEKDEHKERVDSNPEAMSDDLDSDFSFHVFDAMLGKEALRSIKIKCPGVSHNDVLVDVMFNGCVVSIERKPSHGVGATAWMKKFQFKASDGLFDFKDDQVTLEGGFLTLVFRAFRGRAFRFPRHFDMSSADVEDAWLYSEASPAIEPHSSHPLARASHALRIAAAPDCVTVVPSQVLSGVCHGVTVGELQHVPITQKNLLSGSEGDSAAAPRTTSAEACPWSGASSDESEDFEKL